jgi:hypothetical protein
MTLFTGDWWLSPVILATWEAEIRRIAVWSQPQANGLWDPISKIPNSKKGWRSGSSNRASMRYWVQITVLPKKRRNHFLWVRWAVEILRAQHWQLQLIYPIFLFLPSFFFFVVVFEMRPGMFRVVWLLDSCFWDRIGLCRPGWLGSPVLLPQHPECWDYSYEPPHPCFYPFFVCKRLRLCLLKPWRSDMQFSHLYSIQSLCRVSVSRVDT